MEKRAKILIVDDEFALREILSFILKDKYSVATAGGAAEAFDYLANNSVDLVLLDINMPRMDGITALQEIKTRHPGIGVIFVTAFAALETIRKGINLGAFGFIMKPFDQKRLMNMVEEALRNGPPGNFCVREGKGPRESAFN
ncbi:MAG: response regulator [Nitrospirae bacterium]|nr:response regulator [Nitrospirota bacterium]